MDLLEAITNRLGSYQHPKKALLLQLLAGMAYALGQGYGVDANGQLLQTNNPFLLPAPEGEAPAASMWGVPVATFATPEQGVDAFFASPMFGLYASATEVFTDTYALAMSLISSGVIKGFIDEDANAFMARYIASASLLGAAFALHQGSGALADESQGVQLSPSDSLLQDFAEVPVSEALGDLLTVGGKRAWLMLALANNYGVLRDPATGEIRTTGNYTLMPCPPEQASDPAACFLGFFVPSQDPYAVKEMMDGALVTTAKTMGIENEIASGDAGAWAKLGAQMSGRTVDEMAVLLAIADLVREGAIEKATSDLPSAQKMALVLFNNGDLLQEFGWLKAKNEEGMTRDLFGLLYYGGIQSFFGDANVGRFNYGRLMKDGAFLEYANEVEGLRAMLEDLKVKADVVSAIQKGDIDAMIVAMARSSPDAGTFDEKVGSIFLTAKNAYEEVAKTSGDGKTGFSAPNMERVKQLSQMPPGQSPDGATSKPVPVASGRPWWHYGLGGLVTVGVGYGAYKLWQRWQKKGGA